MDLPKEGQRVMVFFKYANKTEESPATYTQGQFLIDFYNTQYPVSPYSWVPIAEAEEKPKLVRPKPLDRIVFADVLKMAEQVLKDREADPGGEHKDEAEYMFEAVMVAIYGDKVFKYLNNL